MKLIDGAHKLDSANLERFFELATAYGFFDDPDDYDELRSFGEVEPLLPVVHEGYKNAVVVKFTKKGTGLVLRSSPFKIQAVRHSAGRSIFMMCVKGQCKGISTVYHVNDNECLWESYNNHCAVVSNYILDDILTPVTRSDLVVDFGHLPPFFKFLDEHSRLTKANATHQLRLDGTIKTLTDEHASKMSEVTSTMDKKISALNATIAATDEVYAVKIKELEAAHAGELAEAIENGAASDKRVSALTKQLGATRSELNALVEKYDALEVETTRLTNLVRESAMAMSFMERRAGGSQKTVARPLDSCPDVEAVYNPYHGSPRRSPVRGQDQPTCDTDSD